MSTVKSVLSRQLNSQSTELTETTLLSGVLEGMLDGILVVTALGEIRYANQSGQEICQQLSCTSRSQLPLQIWQMCLALLETQQLFPNQVFILEDEIYTEQAQHLRVRVRSIECAINEACLLVTIENRDRNHQSVLIEAQRYGLTRRETEVWMLRRSNLSYKAIAAKLHIAIDTVKKHIKNIRAKQQVALWHEQR